MTCAVATWLTLIVGVLTTGTALLAPWLVARVLAPGFPPHLQELTVRLMRLMLVSTVIFSLSGLVMGVLHAHRRFLFPALAPAFYNVGIILGVLALAPRWGVYGLATGVVAGAVAHLGVQLPAVWRLQPQLSLQLGLHDPNVAGGVRDVVRLMVPRVAGLAVVQVNFIVTTVLASFLNPRALPALDYAWRIMLLPQGIFALAVATAAFPTFAAQAARLELSAMRHTFTTVLRSVLFLTSAGRRRARRPAGARSGASVRAGRL
ncbi:MAG: lipid II flippase MurJ [Ardenticatenia bacterium]|nr:lipid II flippase MurJ [Ardenticatenia bacterium]